MGVESNVLSSLQSNRKSPVQEAQRYRLSKSVRIVHPTAEAVFQALDPFNDAPIVLLDYETSDADLDKMRNKFNYIRAFAKYTTSIRAIAFFITVKAVQQHWKPATHDEREHFASVEIPDFAGQFHSEPRSRIGHVPFRPRFSHCTIHANCQGRPPAVLKSGLSRDAGKLACPVFSGRWGREAPDPPGGGQK